MKNVLKNYPLFGKHYPPRDFNISSFTVFEVHCGKRYNIHTRVVTISILKTYYLNFIASQL